MPPLQRAAEGSKLVNVGPRIPVGIATPATIIFADRLEQNLSKMAAFATQARTNLRPHAKTHKCLEIAERQVALGATGLSVATVGEAEILTRRGRKSEVGGLTVTDVFVAYPIWLDDEYVERLGRLADRVRVTVGTDSPEAVARG